MDSLIFNFSLYDLYNVLFYLAICVILFFVLRLIYKYLLYYNSISYSIYFNFLNKKLSEFFSKSNFLSKLKDYLSDKKFFLLIKYLILSFILIYIFSFLPVVGQFLTKFLFCIIIILFVFIIRYVFDAFLNIYQTYDISKQRPLKSYLQLLMIFVYFISGISILSIIFNRSPLVFLSGIGVIATVLLLIFKDTILGLVTSFQLSSNKMLKIGDWLEMFNFDADGEVIEITLHTIKVRNWDNTVTIIPAYKFISEPFKHWSSMTKSGARRIKRSIYIDINSIKFCNNNFLQKLEHNLSFYYEIKSKIETMQIFDSKIHTHNNLDDYFNFISNLSIFRAYLFFYLKNHPYIYSNDRTLIIRHLPSSSKGLPIEIYAFSKKVEWDKYEELQSSIFEHIFSIIPIFELKVFQDFSDY